MKRRNTVVFLLRNDAAACRLECICCGGGREKIRDYHCDALVAIVLSHPRLWPFSLDEDVVANNGSLSGQRQGELKETEEEKKQPKEE